MDVAIPSVGHSLRLNRPQGVRSLSIQNNSTKVSSFSDTHSDGSHIERSHIDGDKSNSSKLVVRSGTRNGEDGGNACGGGIITSDIMELISEEELSVCRSEGSPPRKPKKRKTNV